MARLIQQPKEEHLNYLRNLIVNTFSRSVCNVSDCKLLEEAIFKAISQRVSVDTLRRLFNILKSNSSPSTFTLDLCSNYVGYNSWESLVQSYSEQNILHQKVLVFDVIENDISFDDFLNRLGAFSRTKELYETFNQIILAKSQKEDTVFFERIFELRIVFEFNEIFKYNIYHSIHLLACLCMKNEWLKNIAINNYFNLPYENDYFVEWLVVPENNYYAELLENYYQSKKSDKQVVLFYSLIKCTQFFETENWDLFLAHYKIIEGFDVKKNPIINILKMRYLGVQLYWDKHFNESRFLKNLKDNIVKHSYINAKDAGDRVSSIFIICQYLSNVNAYETIILLYEQNANRHSKILGYWAELNFNQLKVYYAFALLKLEQNEKSKIIFEQIDVHKFDLNFKYKIVPIYKEMEKILLG
jgi:hypothetical protein